MKTHVVAFQSKLLLATMFVVGLWPTRVLSIAPPDAVYEDYIYVHCLKEKFKDVRRDVMNHEQAFDQSSGRNFFWDKQRETWRDGKTGEDICPKKSAKSAVYEDYVYVHCLKEKFKDVRRDVMNHGQAFDQAAGRNFFWDKDKQSWRDGKTGECICPKCSEQPARTAQGPNATDVLKSIASHVSVGVGVSGGGGEGRHHHHADDRRRADEKLTRDEKRLHGDEARKAEKHRAEEKLHDDNRVKIAHDPQIQRAQEELERLQKKKAELERRHRETKDKDEKKMLERQIKGYDTLIEHEQAKLNRR
jgi:hypothetical protein